MSTGTTVLERGSLEAFAVRNSGGQQTAQEDTDPAISGKKGEGRKWR